MSQIIKVTEQGDFKLGIDVEHGHKFLFDMQRLKNISVLCSE